MTIRRNLKTEETLQRICDSLKQGATIRAAVNAIGRSHDWLRLWRLEDPRVERELQKALAQWENSAVVKINENADWKATAWLLARRNPDEYGDRKRVDIHAYDQARADAEAASLLGLDPPKSEGAGDAAAAEALAAAIFDDYEDFSDDDGQA